VTCVRGKEKQTVGELYDLFESLAEQIWPTDVEHNFEKDAFGSKDIADSGDSEFDLEAQVAREIAGMKRPRKDGRFANCRTDTPCVVFISCKPPVDPVQLVLRHVENVENTGVLHTRYTMRLLPVSGTCTANIPEIQALCQRIFGSFFTDRDNREPRYTYKIELRVRNHNSLSRPKIIQEIARCIPAQHTVDLENPDIFVLVEVFKSVCGISVVRDYYRRLKFNVMEIANARNKNEMFGE